MLKRFLSAIRPGGRPRAPRPYAYHDAPERLDPDVLRTYGRLWIARAPDGQVKAAGWDCGEARHAVRRWLGYGLRLELVARSLIDEALAGDARRVYEMTTPIGAVLEPAEAEAALRQD